MVARRDAAGRFASPSRSNYAFARSLVGVSVGRIIDDAIRHIVKLAVEAITEGSMSALRPFARPGGDLEAFIDKQKIEFYNKLGKQAWDVMMSEYAQKVSHHSTGLERRSRLSGRLKIALSEDFYYADSSGLHFGNIARLDSEAKHWRRITFGAKPVGQGINSEFDLTLDGRTVGQLGLNMSASDRFQIPPGFWTGPSGGPPAGRGGGDQFWPDITRLYSSRGRGRPAKWRPTQGIETHDYITPALRAMSQEFPEALAKMLREVERQIFKNVPKETHVVVEDK